MAKTNIGAGMVSVGFQTLSLANSTALGLNTTVAPGKVFCLSVETNNARFRADGTNPALTTGVLLQKDQHYWIFDVPGSTLKFQRQTGTSKISIQAWKYKGE
jgi:hypothetical protein